jgi:sulfate adenylyltransferase large subunit
MRPLRLMTCGHVDDGKSTLIGRLLLDSGSLYEDQLAEAGGNLAHFTDGLKAERDLGITIDIAYRFFRTSKRKFILVDAPGHVQFTRNMVTGASQVDVALLLIDASRGLSEQTFRHSQLVNLLGLEKLFVLVNKMDLVDHSKDKYEEICREFQSRIPLSIDSQFLPISALSGENIVQQSTLMPWYQGPCLLPLLENFKSKNALAATPFQLSVQLVSERSRSSQSEFAEAPSCLSSVLCAGTVFKGSVKVGDELQIVASGKKARVRQIFYQLKSVPEAVEGMAISLEFNKDQSFQRGDWLCSPEIEVLQSEKPFARVVWMQSKPGLPGSSWILRQGQFEVRCKITQILDRKEIHQLQQDEPVDELSLNDIARVKLNFDQRIFYQRFATNRQLGSAVLIDPEDYSTAAAVLFE